MLGRYTKMWICLAVGAVWVAMKYFDMVPDGFDTVVVDASVVALQTLGVERLANA